MKNFILFSFLLFLSLSESYAQWMQTSGPGGGLIHAFGVSGPNIFAGSNKAGVFVSTNNGVNWTSVNNGLTNLDVLSFTSSGSNIFAGTMNGAFLSTNNGANWTGINTGLTSINIFSLLAVSDSNLFAGTNGKVFRSTNNGTTWVLVGTGLPAGLNWKISLAVSDTNLFCGTAGSGIYRSTNNGTNWTTINVGMTATYVYSILVVDTNIFIGTNSGAFISSNNGNSWTAISNGITSSYVLNLKIIGSNLFAGTNDAGVFVSTNNGQNWTPVNNGLTYSNIQSLAVLGTNLFAGTYRGGVFHSENTGADWVAANDGLINTDVNAFVVQASELYAGTSNGVFSSENDGGIWTRVSTGLTNTDVRSLAIYGVNYFAGTEGGSVFRSTDDCESWTSISIGLPTIPHRAIAVAGSNLFVAGYGAGGGVFLSTDNGDNWTAVNNGLTSTSIVALVVSDTNLFAGALGMTGGVFRSTNNGANWTRMVTGMTNVNVYSLAISGTNLFAGTYGGGVFLSTNNGDSWIAVNSGLTSTQVLSLAAFSGNLFAGTNGGVFLSTNNGTNWSAVNSGLMIGSGINSLLVSETNLFAGTICFGAWKRPLIEMIPNLIPTAPIDLIATADTFFVDLTWTENSDNELGYVIERKDGDSSSVNPFVPIDTVGINVNSYVDGSVNPNTTYQYKIYAFNLFGNSGFSNTVEATTFQSAPTTFQLSVTVTSSWNMVSAPGLNPGGMGVSTWWPHLTGTVWAFDGTIYLAKTATTPGEGYWMKNTLTETYDYPAIQIVAHDAIPGHINWNIIGVYEDPVPTSGLTTNPGGQITGTVWGFNGTTYVNMTGGTLQPGYGYWVKLLSACDIIIPEALAKGSGGEVAEYYKSDWGKIQLTDAAGISFTLYAVNGEVDLDQYEMPPAPPSGMFDVRYSSGRVAEDINSSMKTIDLNGITYPLTLRVEGMDIRLQDVSGKTINQNLKSGESVVISDATIQKLMVTNELLPTVYALEQNYPNPFNPSTVIEFSLPEDVSNVKLSVYNALGEKVAELVNSGLTAGRYSYQWNAKNLATGMYIYELRTDKFVSVKKMLLLK